MERGVLDGDESIWRYITELPLQRTHRISIRHLLYHTSGLRDYLALERLASRDPNALVSCKQVFDLLGRQRGLNFLPGRRHLYSNSGYFLLGRIVERASGCGLSDFLHRELLGPLGMKDTTVRDKAGMVVRNRAHGHEASEGAFRQLFDIRGFVGASGLFSSLNDLVAWNRTLENASGGRGIMGFGDRLRQRGTLSDGTGINYSYGMYVTTHCGLPMLYHPAQWNGSRHAVVRFPSENLCVVALSNCAAYRMYNLALSVGERYLGLQVPECTSAARDLQSSRGGTISDEYRGRFVSSELEVEYDLEVEDDILRLTKAGTVVHELWACGGDKFQSDRGWRLEGIREGAGGLRGFLLGNSYAWGVRFSGRFGGGTESDRPRR